MDGTSTFAIYSCSYYSANIFTFEAYALIIKETGCRRCALAPTNSDQKCCIQHLDRRARHQKLHIETLPMASCGNCADRRPV